MEIEFVLILAAIVALVGIVIWMMINEEKARRVYIEHLKEEGYEIMYIYRM
jgi:hypothetical protein